jgi:ribosomal protein S18 acetylase RimI-like enzyme
MAFGGGRALGFVSGIETTHPDKGTEMFLYELSVEEEARRRGVGTKLVQARPQALPPPDVRLALQRRRNLSLPHSRGLSP